MKEALPPPPPRSSFPFVVRLDPSKPSGITETPPCSQCVRPAAVACSLAPFRDLFVHFASLQFEFGSAVAEERGLLPQDSLPPPKSSSD